MNDQQSLFQPETPLAPSELIEVTPGQHIAAHPPEGVELPGEARRAAIIEHRDEDLAAEQTGQKQISSTDTTVEAGNTARKPMEMPGRRGRRTNWEALPMASDVQKGMTDSQIDAQHAKNEVGALAARMALRSTRS